MTLKRKQLVGEYVASMHDGDAALFIGAGMSRPAGFVDWRGLLADCALELGLDIKREHDLVAVAQYYLNHRVERGRLNQIIKNEFDRPGTFSPNHVIIGRLPVSTVWTTNFDSLLEQAFSRADRVVDVKIRDTNLAMSKRGREVILYKMHGDINAPEDAVICKDDYERYAKKHPLIQNQLEADLINKNFLFLGFSFTDPHLDYMLSHLRTLLENNKRQHYAVMRKVRLAWNHPDGRAVAQEVFEYETNKQALQIEDLRRYGIQTHLIDQYKEVTDILKLVEEHYYRKNVFVSGSAHEFGEFGEERMRDFCARLGARLVDRGRRLVSGFGLNVGDSVVHGAVLRLREKGSPVLEKHMMLRPFPRNLPPDVDGEDFHQRYREDIIFRCGFAVFVAGTSRTRPVSEGVLQEYRLARKLKKVVIPVGATGFAARRIWEEIEPDVESAYSGAVSREQFGRLNDAALDNDKLLDTVFGIIDQISAA